MMEEKFSYLNVAVAYVMLFKIVQFGVLQWWQLNIAHITIHVEKWFHSIRVGCTRISVSSFCGYNCDKRYQLYKSLFNISLIIMRSFDMLLQKRFFNVLIPCTVSKCLFRRLFTLNDLLHFVHVVSSDGSFGSCIRRWDRNLFVVILSFWQMQHLQSKWKFEKEIINLI